MLTAVSGRSIVGLVKPVPDILMTVGAYRVGHSVTVSSAVGPAVRKLLSDFLFFNKSNSGLTL